MNMQEIDGGVCAAEGFLASGLHCGIRKNKEKRDVALVYSKSICNAASCYTQNKVKGSPIIITKQNLVNGKANAIICNSGNANTCNADGEEKALAMCELTAEALGISAQDVIVASTGVIGQPLDIAPIENGMKELAAELSQNGADNAAEAIMTTDTIKKQCAVSFEINGKTCKIGGMAKGSGMIHPNMATMLCFITTDAAISSQMLQRALSDCVVDTYNMVSVDGDTSTNDMVSVLANGIAENDEICAEGQEYEAFKAALMHVCTRLCKLIAKDGEGASKLLECTVSSAPDKKTARIIAKSVITSSLFKAAMFGQDANWGRILCAVGYADAEFDIDKVDVEIKSENGAVQVCKDGTGVAFSEEKAAEVLKSAEINIDIALNGGAQAATAWGCDLTYDYVKINGDYRT